MKKFILFPLCILIVCTQFAFADAVSTPPADTTIMKIWPNPTHDIVTVQLDTQAPFIIQIYTVGGRWVTDNTPHFRQGSLSIKDLKPGVYPFRAIDVRTKCTIFLDRIVKM